MLTYVRAVGTHAFMDKSLETLKMHIHAEARTDEALWCVDVFSELAKK